MTGRAISLTPAVLTLLAAADELLSGEPGFLVGGSLRDTILDRDVTDVDLAVSGDAPRFARALADHLDGHFVLLDASRGIARVALDQGPVRLIDVTSMPGDIRADLGRRDFTIDALAAPLGPLARQEPAEIIDPHGGIADLENGIVRLVSERALVEDPLRLLRAVRLVAQLDFRLAPETADAIRRHAERVARAAAERRRDELARCLATSRAARTLRLMDDLELLDRLLPEVTAGRGVTQPKEHYWNVLDHALETVACVDYLLSEEEPADRREARFWHTLWSSFAPFLPELRQHLAEEVSEGRSRATLLKLGALLHDVAKPETRSPDATGRVRFFGHSEKGAETARHVLLRYRFSRREIDLVATMVEAHLRPGQLSQQGPPSRRALFRFFRDTGAAAESVLLLSLADHAAARGPRLRTDGWRRHVAYIAHILARRDEEEAIVRPQRFLTGDDIMAALSLGPGPEVGRLLAELEEAQASGEIRSREEALAFVRSRRPAREARHTLRAGTLGVRLHEARRRHATPTGAGGRS